jgi:hypothetical protein
MWFVDVHGFLEFHDEQQQTQTLICKFGYFVAEGFDLLMLGE